MCFKPCIFMGVSSPQKGFQWPFRVNDPIRYATFGAATRWLHKMARWVWMYPLVNIQKNYGTSWTPPFLIGKLTIYDFPQLCNKLPEGMILAMKMRAWTWCSMSYVSLPEGSQKQEEQRGDDLQDHHLVIPSRMRKWLCLCDPQKNMGWPIPWGTTPKIFPTIHWDCRLDPHRSATDPSTFWSLCRWFDPSDLNQWWSNFLIIWIGNNYCVNRWVRLFRSFL